MKYKNSSAIENKNIVDFGQIKSIGTRKSFLDESKYQEISTTLKNKEPVLFMPFSVSERTMRKKYVIVLTGTMLDGRKMVVRLKNMEVYFDILIKNNSSNKEIKEATRKIINTSIHYSRCKIIEAKPFMLFQEIPNKYMRVYFDTLSERRKALNIITKLGFETASNSGSHYYHIVRRNYDISFSNWILISKYKYAKCDRIVGKFIDADINDCSIYSGEQTKDMINDKLLEMSWDIETYSPANRVPLPRYPEDSIFMIGITFFWYYEKVPLLKLCISTGKMNPPNDFIIINCENEEQLLTAFAKIIKQMKPDIVDAFNDSLYDWRWIIRRSYMLGGKENILAKYAEYCNLIIPYDKAYSGDMVYDGDKGSKSYSMYKTESVKIAAGHPFHVGRSFQSDMFISLDVRTLCRRKYPKVEVGSTKLSTFLENVGLEPKKDMPIPRLLEICKLQRAGEPMLNEMLEVADYCVRDAESCHDLMLKENFIRDAREDAETAQISIYFSLFRASSAKVQNLTMYEGTKMGYVFDSTRHTDKEEKYPGAHVFNPERGLYTSKLTIEQNRNKLKSLTDKQIRNMDDYEEYKEWDKVSDDEAKQMEHIVLTYGAVLDENMIKRVRLENENLPECFFKFLQRKTGRPITGLDFSSLYPSIAITYNLSPEMIVEDPDYMECLARSRCKSREIKFSMKSGTIVQGWSINHENKEEKYGIYPKILSRLFKERKMTKKIMEEAEDELEEIDKKIHSDEIANNIELKTKNQLEQYYERNLLINTKIYNFERIIST
jgi:DNA polymerase elongation subunit (family B)